MNNEDDNFLGDLSRAYTLLRRHFDKAMNEQGASLAQTRILLMIDAGEGKARASVLADRFGVAPRTITEALDVLERDGLIERIPDRNDRRTKRLRTTPAGAAAVGATEPLRRQLARDILAKFSENERRDFQMLLRKMMHLLSE